MLSRQAVTLWRTGNYEPLPCNAFAWCSEVECFEPDAHKHTLGDCWLKYTEGPASPEVQRSSLHEANSDQYAYVI